MKRCLPSVGCTVVVIVLKTCDVLCLVLVVITLVVVVVVVVVVWVFGGVETFEDINFEVVVWSKWLFVIFFVVGYLSLVDVGNAVCVTFSVC